MYTQSLYTEQCIWRSASEHVGYIALENICQIKVGNLQSVTRFLAAFYTHFTHILVINCPLK